MVNFKKIIFYEGKNHMLVISIYHGVQFMQVQPVGKIEMKGKKEEPKKKHIDC
jgi:hypothetical protein